MKTVLKSFLSLAALLLLAGCYTELATVEPGEHRESGYPYATDTVTEGGNVTINNHYYLDDDYRRSRLRVSLNYYYPSYSSYIGAYYDSYFNDPYWGMYHRPSWYYDPFYPWYCPPIYTGPYWDPWYPYYPPIAYYPVYYPVYYPTGSDYTPRQPGRLRGDGATRDPNISGDRPRPASPGSPVAGPVTDRPNVSEGRPVEPTRPIRQPETPWWEKMQNERPVRDPNGEARPTESGPVKRPPVVDRPVGSPRPIGGSGAEDRPVETTRPTPGNEGRPVDRPVGTTQSPRPSVGEDRPVEQPKRPAPSYTPPPQQQRPSGNDEARPAERPRESRQPSYTPAPHAAPPQSTPPRSSGGSGNGGRRRD